MPLSLGWEGIRLAGRYNVGMASGKSLTVEEQKKWVAQWKKAASGLDEQRARDLAGMTDAQASAAIAAVLDRAASLPLRSDRETHSGLVELQAYLRKLGSK